MQYGADLLTYQRIKKAGKEEKKKQVNSILILKLVVFFGVSFLISRVLLINSMAPFGIAFLITMIVYNEDKLFLAAGFGSVLGYITIQGQVKNVAAYIAIAGTVTVLNYLNKDKKRNVQLLFAFSAAFLEFLAYKFFVDSLTFGVAFIFSALEAICIFPVYFILNYALVCFKNIDTKHLFSSEELISMAVALSILISGTKGAQIFGVSICNVIALITVIIISYVKGSSIGAASGIAMGTIIGMGTSNMGLYISIFGLCGLITGIFKQTGKWFSALACIVAYSIIKIYSSSGGQFKIIEVLIAGAVFLLIKNAVYERLSLEFSWDKKVEYLSQNYGEKIKNIMLERLNNFSDALFNMSEILDDLADNEKLVMKNKSTALIENLADRVCSNCSMNSICWKRESYQTYNSFSELIRNFQENKNTLPVELDKKCVRRTALLQNTEQIINNYIISEMWRIRLSEGRELLANQIGNMASSVEEIAEEFNTDIRFDSKVESLAMRILDKNKIKYKDIMCFSDKNNRMVIKLSMESCGGAERCIKDILPLFEDGIGKRMCIGEEGCNINPKDKSCSVIFEEAPLYYVASYAGRVCKDGEKYNGDSYTFGKLNDGSYMTVISDGMGSGPEAGEESTAAVDLVEKLTRTGFSKMTAINTVNSVMSLKFCADEKFSTLDLSSIDLYSGEVDFMKVGAAPSFIKSQKRIEVIDSKSLPIGVLDKVDVDVTQRKVKNGDIIVMLSDGVLDYNNDVASRVNWMIHFLENTTCNSPSELADEIIEKAKELNGGRVRDDMTVVVSKVYSLS